MRLKLFMIGLADKVPLDENDYGDEIKRDDNNGRECFVTRTHFRGKDKKFYSPAFKIILDDGETDEYTLAYSADGINFTNFQRTKDFFYDPTVGAVNPGVTYIHVFKNGVEVGKPRRLLAWPSSMSWSEYEAMINDLIFIRRELIQNSKSKSSLPENFKPLCDANNWQAVLENLKVHVAELTEILQRIDAYPRYGLKSVKKFLRPAQIRRFDEKFFRQYLQFPNRKKYLVSGEEITFNIFENRLLKMKLADLKSFIKSKTERQQKIYSVTDSNIWYKIAQYLKENPNLSREELLTKWQEFKAAEEKTHADYELQIKSWQDEFENLFENFKSPAPSEGRLTITCHKISPDGKNPLLNWQRYDFGGKKLLVISTDELPQRIAFWSAIKKISAQKINKIKIVGQKRSLEQAVYFDSISSMSLNGEPIVVDKKLIDDEDFEHFKKEYVMDKLKEYCRDKFNNPRAYEEHLQNYQQIISLDRQISLNESQNQNDSAQDEIVKNLEKCLALKFFSDVDDADEKWRMTQIFTNDENYHRAYVKLHELDEIFDFSFEENEQKILLAKTDKIYEFWILAKILEFLIVKQGWQTVDGENNHIKIFREFFSDFNAEDKFKNRPPIILKHKVNYFSDMTLEIFYDTQIKSSLHKPSNLRPDFLFRVTLNGVTKIFILDAKYRNYGEMKKNYWSEEDLKGVCAEKYIKRLEEEIGEEISAALIVHSDKTLSDKKILGKYVIFNGLKNSYRQIGSFYLLPNVEGEKFNQSEDNLTAFFQMIFEYYMGQWKICWQCGSENVQETVLATVSNNPKYHYQCKKCGAFWVKNHCNNDRDHHLLKHFVNYHVEKGGRWLVRCPICGD